VGGARGVDRVAMDEHMGGNDHRTGGRRSDEDQDDRRGGLLAEIDST
jgi:hypothetical protein